MSPLIDDDGRHSQMEVREIDRNEVKTVCGEDPAPPARCCAEVERVIVR